MRSVRTMIGLAAAVCALGACAAPALAKEESKAPEFTASKPMGKTGNAPFPLALKGEGVGLQEFTFKKVHVTCKAASAKGSIAESPAKTISLTVTYKECTTGPIVIWGKRTEVPMKFKEKPDYTFHYNGYLSNSEEIEMQAKYLKCVVDWDPGTFPEKALEDPTLQYEDVAYANEGSKLLIMNMIKKGEWEEEGGGACEDVELAEGENGKYTGNLLVEVHNGTINVGAPAEA
jgi:hypothetical protein